jgi:phosphoribosylformylglycinamidine synthase
MYGNGSASAPDEPGAILRSMLGSPSISSKQWAFEQYDSIVGSRTVRRPESADAAVLVVPESDRAIALSIDGNGRRVACDPYAGTVEAVLECAQNLACVGAEPLGLTNCLNFGNPEKGNVAWQLDRSTQALADACGALEVPVVGGNVSLYNETEAGPIYPTPVVGMVGELADPERSGGASLREGDAIALVGPFAPSLAGSELAKLRGELGPGLPVLPVDVVRAAIELVREVVRAGAVRTAHDVSDGGLAVALAEAAILGDVGAVVDLGEFAESRGLAGEVALFGEGAGGFVLAGERPAIESLVETVGAPGAFLIGEAKGDAVSISAGETALAVPLADATGAWRSLGERMMAPGR